MACLGQSRAVQQHGRLAAKAIVIARMSKLHSLALSHIQARHTHTQTHSTHTLSLFSCYPHTPCLSFCPHAGNQGGVVEREMERRRERTIQTGRASESEATMRRHTDTPSPHQQTLRHSDTLTHRHTGTQTPRHTDTQTNTERTERQQKKKQSKAKRTEKARQDTDRHGRSSHRRKHGLHVMEREPAPLAARRVRSGHRKQASDNILSAHAVQAGKSRTGSERRISRSCLLYTSPSPRDRG
eukprot:1974385-Rhodomonas_salina.1